MNRNDDLFDKTDDTVEDMLPDDDIVITRKKPRASSDEDVKQAPPRREQRAQSRPEQPRRRENVEEVPQDQLNFTAREVNEAAAAISTLMESGKLASAIDIAFTLKGALRESVRDTVTVTIPLGSHPNELRQIAAGAMIQSYLEQGKVVRRDLEEKLYAIIESSEPEYDEDDEIIEQSPEEIQYKVTACIVFCAHLAEASGDHPTEKSALYGAGDSVLDTFLSENIDLAMKKSRRHITALADAIRPGGGTVSAKLDAYMAESAKNIENPIMKFLGDTLAFRVTACVIAALCLVALIVYLCTRSGLLSLFATDNTVMLFVIAAEVFFTAGMVLLAILLGAKSFNEEKPIPKKRPNAAQR